MTQSRQQQPPNSSSSSTSSSSSRLLAAAEAAPKGKGYGRGHAALNARRDGSSSSAGANDNNSSGSASNTSRSSGGSSDGSRNGGIDGKPLRYLLTSNLYNSQEVLPHMVFQIVRLAAVLPHGSLSVSIYESGSTDRTDIWLSLLKLLLFPLGVSFKVDECHEHA